MDAKPPPLARSFGSVAGAYSRGRPSYPREAAAWLAGDEARVVLELGAGTGKLTEQLAALGHDVYATDPDDDMLSILAARHPRIRVAQAAAEEIPAPDRSVDVVVAAQCFHWFDTDAALPEIARILKPGGVLSVVWNQRDERIPWVRRLGAIMGTQDQSRDPAAALAASDLFGPLETQSFRFWQTLDRGTVQDLALSRSNVAVLDPEERAAKLAEVLAFYDEYGRGMDGMQLPYTALCFRAVVQHPPALDIESTSDRDAGGAADTDETGGQPGSAARSSDGGDTEMLLIDFH